jgi:hypothetical protein
MTERRFPPPWSVEKIPGGLKVCDANGQSLAYVYSRENPNDAHIAKVLTEDEARGIASNLAKLPELLSLLANADRRAVATPATSIVAPDPNAVLPAPIAA